MRRGAATLAGPHKAQSIGPIAPLPPNLHFIVVKVSNGDYTLPGRKGNPLDGSPVPVWTAHRCPFNRTRVPPFDRTRVPGALARPEPLNRVKA